MNQFKLPALLAFVFLLFAVESAIQQVGGEEYIMTFEEHVRYYRIRIPDPFQELVRRKTYNQWVKKIKDNNRNPFRKFKMGNTPMLTLTQK